MYSIDCLITTDNDGIRNAVNQLLPTVNDPKVNIYDYQNKEGVNSDGVAFLMCKIRFNVKSDRDGILNSIKGLTGVVNACDMPSYVRPHVCGGDSVPCTIEDGGIYK